MARIGIIAGSGPEAGLDLWAKVLAATRHRLGAAYRGDLDAPDVTVVSEPRLGWSMDLDAHHEQVWDALAAAATRLAPQVDVYGIACNTLNGFGPRLRALGLGAELVTTTDVVAEWLGQRPAAGGVALLGARPVAELGRWSPYRFLAESCEVEVPDLDEMHALIEAVKVDGGADPRHGARLRDLIATTSAPTVLLACTELPLLGVEVPGRELVDVTAALAGTLVDRARVGPAPEGRRAD